MPQNHVAVVDLKSQELSKLDKTVAERKPHQIVPVPRLKSHVDIYLSDKKGETKEIIARVNVSRLGMGYNFRRLVSQKQLYIYTN
ncbi:hypothetical protein PGQ11_010274 [Apiospora arundinis]|uniref:PilZ domain-containing protein n=1 Tax=Apiospora arundinis TaxID=335852 RepID=A0ABR2I9C7_9PEZI